MYAQSVTRWCVIRGTKCLPFGSFRVHPQSFGGLRVAYLCSFRCSVVFLMCIACLMLSLSLGCLFLIAPSVFSNVYLLPMNSVILSERLLLNASWACF